jgi:hypothetical protein
MIPKQALRVMIAFHHGGSERKPMGLSGLYVDQAKAAIEQTISESRKVPLRVRPEKSSEHRQEIMCENIT